MSDTENKPVKNTLLTVLVLLLLLFVSVQAWYMYDIKRQLDVLEQQPEESAVIQEKASAEEKVAAIIDTSENPVEAILPDTDKAETTDNTETRSVSTPDENLPADGNQSAENDDFSDSTFAGNSWNPYKEIDRFQRKMDRIFEPGFDRFNNRPGFNHPGFKQPGFNHPGVNNPRLRNPGAGNQGFQHYFSHSMSTPKIDVKENATQYVVFVNLPGANENDISVTLNGQRLSIKGKQDYKTQDKDDMGNIIFQERRSGRFQRSITLSRPVDQNKMKTHLDNGVLTVTIPKIRNAYPR